MRYVSFILDVTGVLAAILAVLTAGMEIGAYYLTGLPLSEPGPLRGWIAYGLAMTVLGKRCMSRLKIQKSNVV